MNDKSSASNKQSFFSIKNILGASIVFIIVTVGVIFFSNQKSTSNNGSNNPTGQVSSEEGKMVEGFSGKVLAGTTSPYVIFNKADYDKAQASGKIVFLDFYANWCPICRAEAPELKAGFDNLTSDKVVGFRVNFNDSDTDNDEKALAKQFDVPYQHTKVILKDGKVALKSGDSWDKEMFAKEFGKLL